MDYVQTVRLDVGRHGAVEFTFGHHETGGSKKKIDEEDTNLGIDFALHQENKWVPRTRGRDDGSGGRAEHLLTGRFDIRHRDPRALSSGRLSIQVFVLERTNQYLLENPRCGMFV